MSPFAIPFAAAKNPQDPRSGGIFEALTPTTVCSRGTA